MAAAAPFAAARDDSTSPNADPVFLEVYITPEHPFGSDWTTGVGGDVITIYARVANNYHGADPDNPEPEVYFRYFFCNRVACFPNVNGLMTLVGGDLYKCELNGDTSKFPAWDTYEASAVSGQHIGFWLYADSADLTGYAFYPGPSSSEFQYIYPSWPAASINGTASLSKSSCYPGESLTVAGNAKFWNSTSLPIDLDPTMTSLIDCEGCFVNATVNGVKSMGKVGANGDFSVQITAPSTPGPYPVSIAVTNGSANRNVATNIADMQIQVLQPGVEVTATLTPSTVLPAQNATVNGTVRLDNGTIPAGAQVNVSIAETGNYWLTTVASSGIYNTEFVTPNITGVYHVNVSARHPVYNVRGYMEKVLTVVAVPVPDIVVEAADISVQGHLVQGKTISINVTVRNEGIVDANGTRVNVTLDGDVLSSARFNIPHGGYAVSRVTWNATPGTHNVSVVADPAKEIAESSEVNNMVWKNIVVQADADKDGIPNDTDDDDDNDGYLDVWETNLGTDPLDPLSAPQDADKDGAPNGDADNSQPWMDTDDDDDGYPDAWERNLCTDPLDDASFPLDTDGDGTPDGDPGNTQPWMDDDDDNDGVPDSEDAFPKNNDEWSDLDGDGVGDNSDADWDADGYANAADPFPRDTDNDGLPNWLDLDDDGDGVRDSLDAMPLDTDNDGLNNGVDLDDDGDGAPDREEDANWNGRTDPGETNWIKADSDGDGIPDGADPFPTGQVEVPETVASETPGLLVTLLLMIMAPAVLLALGMAGGKWR